VGLTHARAHVRARTHTTIWIVAWVGHVAGIGESDEQRILDRYLLEHD